MAVIPWPLIPVSKSPAAAVRAPVADDVAGMAAALIQSRQTILPKRLGAPAPNAVELAQILSAAAHAPDHGQLLPWRFILVPHVSRERLADVFALALRERDPVATPEQAEQAREKAYRSPVLLLVAVDAVRGDADVDLAERTVSAGCAVQNMLLMATAQGYGSALTSGKALKAEGLRALFQLTASEQALCFVSIGTVKSRKAARVRTVASAYVSTLHPDHGVMPVF
jgi:nitroreductase